MIRTPITVAEAEAGVELALQVLRDIDQSLATKNPGATYEDKKEWEARARNAHKRWTTKLMETRYLRERLSAGEPPETEELLVLRRKLDESERRCRGLVEENQRLRRRPG
jgi:hypothetical protein